jgi:MSHA biogenesis protein MshN
MLKDLDQRHSEQNQTLQSNAAALLTLKQPKTGLIIVITVVATLFIAFAVYLFKQNQQLINTITERERSLAQQEKLLIAQDKSPLAKKTQQTSPANEENVDIITIAPNTRSPAIQSLKTAVTNSAVKASEQSTRVAEPASKTDKLAKKTAEHKQTKTVVTPTEKSINQITTPKSSMSISRRKVSATQLAKQKMAQAQQAMSQNNLTKAETLFEDILMLTPDNKAARKQLAALWFGRKSYQSALNLLSQGITLSPKYDEFRLMQARIYLIQGYSKRAYQVLKAFKQAKSTEYVLTLANIAQQLGKYQQAITSFKYLTTIKPSEARWWLGLAVAYDSNGQYKLALSTYQSAIAQGNLSESALQFTKQRLQELGE